MFISKWVNITNILVLLNSYFASMIKQYWGLAYIKYETILNVWVL